MEFIAKNITREINVSSFEQDESRQKVIRLKSAFFEIARSNVLDVLDDVLSFNNSYSTLILLKLVVLFSVNAE